MTTPGVPKPMRSSLRTLPPTDRIPKSVPANAGVAMANRINAPVALNMSTAPKSREMHNMNLTLGAKFERIARPKIGRADAPVPPFLHAWQWQSDRSFRQ